MTAVKLALVAIGLIFFGYAMRSGAEWARFVAIGALAVALIVRLWESRRKRSSSAR